MSTNQLIRRPTALLVSILALSLAPLAIGCGGDGGEDGPSDHNSPGGSGGGSGGSGGGDGEGGTGGNVSEHPLCDAEPTWEDFGQPFVEQHCVSCHSRNATGDARSKAPIGVDFDTEADLRKHGDKSVSEIRKGTMPKDTKKLDPCYADQLEAFLANG